MGITGPWVKPPEDEPEDTGSWLKPPEDESERGPYSFMSKPGTPKDITRPPDNEKGRGNRPFTFQVEQFPDGVHGVPLVCEYNGQTVGSAMVTFKDGEWSATLQMTSEGAKNLGLELVFQTIDHTLIEPRPRLIARLNANKKMNAITRKAMMDYIDEVFGSDG
jgi:hypothetical protein